MVRALNTPINCTNPLEVWPKLLKKTLRYYIVQPLFKENRHPMKSIVAIDLHANQRFNLLLPKKKGNKFKLNSNNILDNKNNR